MSERHNGGPAFPFPYEEAASEYGPGGWTAHTGMSLRDWFAGQALVGLCAGVLGNTDAIEALHAMNKNEDWAPEQIHAKWAYGFADAMLKARGEQE